MLSWLRNLIAVAASFGATWAGAVWYWRANNVAPGTGDLALYLFVVPATLLLGVWGAGKLRERLAAAPAAAATDAAAAPAQAAAALPPAVSLNIVAAAVHLPHAASVAELRDALADGARPALDGELVDDDGYPVMAARIDGLDDAPLREEFTQWLAGRTVRFDDEQWRALAAGTTAAAELAATLGQHPQIALHEGRADKREPSPLPILRVLCAWPAGWSAEQRDAAAGWFAQLIVAAGWPAERIVTGHSDDVAATLTQLLGAEGTPMLAVVLACASQIGARAVDGLASAGMLFNARHQQGCIPGEGAAALLLADAAQSALLSYGGAPLPALRGIASTQRSGSADDARRTDALALQDACAQALERAHADAGTVAFVAADTDHRGSRVMELMAVLPDRLPQLDAAADVATIGAACGGAAPVTFVAALALASAEAQERAAPALCVANLDPYRRDVAVIAPAAAA